MRMFKVGDKVRCKFVSDAYRRSYTVGKIYTISNKDQFIVVPGNEGDGHGLIVNKTNMPLLLREFELVNDSCSIKNDADYYKWLANRL